MLRLKTGLPVKSMFREFQKQQFFFFVPWGHLPCGSWLDVAWVGSACAGGLSLSSQEGLARTGVGKSVFCRLLLHRHALVNDMEEDSKWT